MLPLLVAEGNHNLFQEGEGLINELGFNQGFSLRTSLLCPLRACQIDQVNLTHHNLLATLDPTPRLQMQGKDAMTPATGNVQLMLGHGPVVLALKEHLQSFLLIIAHFFCQPFNKYVAFLVLLDCQVWFAILVEQEEIV